MMLQIFHIHAFNPSNANTIQVAFQYSYKVFSRAETNTQFLRVLFKLDDRVFMNSWFTYVCTYVCMYNSYRYIAKWLLIALYLAKYYNIFIM